MISGDRSLAQGKRGAFYNTLEEFHKYWERVDIVCPQVQSSKFRVQSLFGNIFIHPSPWSLWLQSFWILKMSQELYREHKFNIITVHEYPPFYNGIGARLLWSKIHVPYILEIHHVPGHPKASGFKERVYRFAMRHFIKYDAAQAKIVRVVNQHQVPRFLIKAGVPAEKIKYMPSAYIDLETFKPMNVEKKYNLVFAGRLGKNKNIAGLIEAVRIVRKSKPDIKLLVIGSGPERQNLESRIKNLGLRENIYFSGWLETAEDVARAYNGARIFINPSFNEGGPRVALEAMACGLSVITTKVGVMPDIIIDGRNGLFVDWNPGDMAEKIRFLLNNPELQNKFSHAGLELVKQFEKKYVISNYAQELQK